MADEKYPEGQLVAQWIGIGMALFAGVGVVLVDAEQPGAGTLTAGLPVESGPGQALQGGGDLGPGLPALG